MRNIVVIAHNLRSAHNVGSLLRTAEGLGVDHVYLTGYTPYPISRDDKRLPHLSRKVDAQIAKTSLGAEQTLPWSHAEHIERIIDELRGKGFLIVGLEQTPGAQALHKFK